MTSLVPRPRIAPVLAALLAAAACFGPAGADDTPPVAAPDADAARLVEEVLRKAGGDGEDSLGDWTRSIFDRALDRAGGAARQTVPGSMSGAGPGSGSTGLSAAPLAAERHAGELPAPRSDTAEILIFTSLSVPAASWRQWARDAAASGAPLVLRGVGEKGLRAAVKEIGERLGGAEAGPGSWSGAGVAIDPRLFRLFGIERVPAVAVVPGGVPPCRSRGCAGDSAPPHDVVTGNIGLAAALEAVAAEGDAGRAVAKAHLQRLRGEERP